MTKDVSALRHVPGLGTAEIRLLDVRLIGVMTALFPIVGLPWWVAERSWLGLGAAPVAVLVGLALALRPPGLAGWVLTATTALTGFVAAYLTLVAQAMSLAAAMVVCVVLQVSALRRPRQAWLQLGVLIVVWITALLAGSAPPSVLRAMVPLTAVLVLLTAITTWTRRYIDALLEQLHHRADHDPLTGLLNRQGLARHLAELEAEEPEPRAGPAVDPVGVLVIDVDHFKAVNDRHGHLAGDEALMWLAALLRGALPPPVLLARYGGEEFLAVVPGTNLDTLLGCAERVRALVATASTPRVVALTVSIGAACGPAMSSFEELVAQADLEVYAAKGAGRNRVSSRQRATPTW